MSDLTRKFYARWVLAENGCWQWVGQINAVHGYGYYNKLMAHRVSYEMHVALIPEGLVIDHLCRNRACVNPDHLEVVTQRENVLRGESPSAVAARRDACSNGHLYTPENLKVMTKPDGRLYRRCRTCSRARQAEYMARKRQQ